MLAIVLKVDSMTEQLGAVTGDGCERANSDAVGAVDVMMLGDSGVISQQQLSVTFRLMGKMRRLDTSRKAGNPV